MVGGLSRIVRLIFLASQGLFGLAYKLHVGGGDGGDSVDGVDEIWLKLMSSRCGM